MRNLRQYFPDPERRTGRTTRMLERAKCATDGGEKVVIVCIEPERMLMIDRMVRAGYYPRRVAIVALDRLETLQGYYDVRVFFDHEARAHLSDSDRPMLDYLLAANMIAE